MITRDGELTDEAVLAKLREALEGKRVVRAEDEYLILDDGTQVHLYESAQDCCASAYGTWVIESDRLDAIITDVKLDVTADSEFNGDGETSRATITVLHNQNPVALADCYADSGNGGYYYSALSLSVRAPDSEQLFDALVIDA